MGIREAGNEIVHSGFNLRTLFLDGQFVPFSKRGSLDIGFLGFGVQLHEGHRA